MVLLVEARERVGKGWGLVLRREEGGRRQSVRCTALPSPPLLPPPLSESRCRPLRLRHRACVRVCRVWGLGTQGLCLPLTHDHACETALRAFED